MQPAAHEIELGSAAIRQRRHFKGMCLDTDELRDKQVGQVVINFDRRRILLEDAQVYEAAIRSAMLIASIWSCHIDHGLFDFTLQMFKLRPHLSPECSIEIAQRSSTKDVGMDDGGAADRQTLHFVDIEPPGRLPVEFVR